jgi:epoxyqueuosine reductase
MIVVFVIIMVMVMVVIMFVGRHLARGHAAWALGRIGGEEARAVLEAAFAAEADEAVRMEIRTALEAAAGLH